MSAILARSTIAFAAMIAFVALGFAQSAAEPSENGAVRVMVKLNADGSRSVYKFDDARHKCIAITTGEDGKLREKIHYDLDDMGRFSTGQIFGPDGHLRFKSRYKYDGGGRMEEEIQMNDKDVVLHKIVYRYDANGRQIGYSILDGSGKLVGRTAGANASPSSSPKSRPKK